METAERIAKAFHEAYERLAPEAGYKTREESAVPWEEVPSENRILMIATVDYLLARGIIEAGYEEAEAGGALEPPHLGEIVVYRSRTGDYDVGAIVNCTVETLNRKGVDAGHVPDLTGDQHVHLTVFTPGKPGMRRGAEDFKTESPHGRGENVSGTYQEWDIGRGDGPGTWRPLDEL